MRLLSEKCLSYRQSLGIPPCSKEGPGVVNSFGSQKGSLGCPSLLTPQLQPNFMHRQLEQTKPLTSIRVLNMSQYFLYRHSSKQASPHRDQPGCCMSHGGSSACLWLVVPWTERNSSETAVQLLQGRGAVLPQALCPQLFMLVSHYCSVLAEEMPCGVMHSVRHLTGL